MRKDKDKMDESRFSLKLIEITLYSIAMQDSQLQDKAKTH